MARAVMLALLMLLPAAGLAQSVLSLDSCRQLAIDNNKQLAVARTQKEMATYNVKSARTKYLPHVDAMAGYELMSREISILNNNQKNTLSNLGTIATSGLDAKMTDMITAMVQKGHITPQLGQLLGEHLGALSSSLETVGNELGSTIRDAFRTNTHNIFAGSITLSQPIYMGGSIKAMNRVAELKESMADDNYDMLLQNVLYEIDATYWLVVSLRHKQQLAASYLDLVKKLHDDVYSMIDQGVAIRADGLNVDVRVNEAEMAKMRVDDNLALAKMLLCQLCGLPMDSPVTLADEEKDLSATTEPMPTGTSTVVDRPELRMLNTTIDIAEQGQRLVTAMHYRPQVALTGGYLLSNPNTFNGFERKFSGTWFLGIVARMPLWDWRDGHYKLAASKAATTIARLEHNELEEKIDLQVQQERFKVKEAYRRLELASKHVSSAEENLRCANLGFKEGVMNLTDVMTAQTAWESAQSQKIDAEIEVKLSLLGLRKAMGQL